MMRCYDANQSNRMPEFCDVALPVPLDTAFTYRIPDGMQPVVGGRVLVPFRQQRMSGVVTALHDRTPKVQTKNVLSVLDAAPVLDEQLLAAGQVDSGLLSGAAGRSV
jgi:primosomal protein N' (replication factor Y) (superfamily II helicase)